MGVAGCSAGCTADRTAGCTVGCTAGASVYESCGSCTNLDSFRFRELLRNRGWLLGSDGCSVDVCGGQCSSIDEGWCNNGRVDKGKYVSGTFGGISVSSIGCEPSVLVRDVGGGSSVDAGEGVSVGVDRIPVTSGGSSASERAL